MRRLNGRIFEPKPFGSKQEAGPLARGNAHELVMTKGHNARIFVVGGSAGSIEALRTILADLPPHFPSPVMVVIHTHAEAPRLLAAVLQRGCQMIVRDAEDGLAPRAGYVYVARPDCHLVIEDGHMRLRHGPNENRSRPAIDPLFRTAADAYGTGTVGIVLSGYLDDGSSGLFRVKKAGGVSIVQDPQDALAPDMPRNAMDRMKPDYVAPASAIGELMVQIAAEPAGTKVTTEVQDMGPQAEQEPGTPAVFTCPECHGTLWELEEGGTLKFKCRVGHAFTADTMLAEQGLDVERALWAALRVLEEHAELSSRLAHRSKSGGRQNAERHYAERAKEAKRNAMVLRDILTNGSRTQEPAPARPMDMDLSAD